MLFLGSHLLLAVLLFFVGGEQRCHSLSPIFFYPLLLLLLLFQLCRLGPELILTGSLLVGQAVNVGLQRLQHVLLAVSLQSAKHHFVLGAFQHRLELLQLLPTLVPFLQQLGPAAL